ncbi:MBL fold metallo-hydrolase [candidate division BRC1 bacterium HGW-BRC1-1]|jgi:phosphoribosyl 1,2-cyclic phosphate phosphodiesterase|nr:MAG: MBL fold metallo-hydrolase [candidate division BRC1 bacterium HGW-BRC1-1]
MTTPSTGPDLRVVLLGTGTSAGVPTLGCTCDVCLSTDPHNKRMRCCAYIETCGRRILIDCGTDLRTQAIANHITDVDMVLLTHTHADHVNGMDDLRAYNMVHRHAINVYGQSDSLDDLRARFAYCFRPAPPGGGVPQLTLHPIEADTDLVLEGVAVRPLTIFHGTLPILGFRIGRFAYLTDVSRIPEETFAALEGVEVLVTSALRRRPHPTHMCISESVEVAKRIGARQTWFIHMCHDLDHDATNATLPPGIALAYDGLSFDV